MKKIFIAFSILLSGGMIFYLARSTKCCRCSCQHDTISTLTLNPQAFYKIIMPDTYSPNDQKNCIQLSPLDKESGFMHISLGSQVLNTLSKFFKNSPRVLLVELDETILEKNDTHMRLEENKPGGEKYPHFYGMQAIPCAAVRNVITVAQQADGSWIEVK